MIPATALQPKRSNASSATRLLIRIVVTLGLLGALASKVNLRAVGDKIGAIGFFSCAVCILVMLLLTIMVAWRWQMILVRMQSPVTFGESWRLVLIGFFFNQILPSGIGGDAVRVWLLTRSGGSLRTGFLSVAADRTFALSAVILCMAGFLPLLLRGPAKWPVTLLTVAGAFAIGGLLLLRPVLGILTRILPDRLYRVAGGLLDRGLNLLRDFGAVLWLILRARPEGPAVIGISIANQIVLGWIVYFIAGRLHVEIGLTTVIALFSPAMLLSMMPISLGGWGVREAALVWLLGTANVPQDASLAISLLFGIVTTVASLVGAVLWLFERRPDAPAITPPPGITATLPIPLVPKRSLVAPANGPPPGTTAAPPIRVVPKRSLVAPANTPAPGTTAAAPIPVVLERSLSVVSPWVSIMARTVDYGSGKIEIYHAIEQADYIAILAVTPDFRIPIVRQYRPALERFTWELPAGMVDPGEDPAATCARELREETGLNARRIHALGMHAADSARLGNSVHSFLVETAEPDSFAKPEPGIVLELVSIERLRALILAGDFDLQLHVATVGLALMQPELARLLQQVTPTRSREAPRTRESDR